MHPFDPNKITFFARTDARGQNVPFGIKAKDRQRHVYVIGKTGMGKSTLLENMAVQDIQNGEGMAFIDPHGSAVETLLSYIPEHRINDVLYFAPFDMDHPVSFNIMEDVGPDKRHLVVSGLMSVFEKIWVDAWSARMAYILQNTLMALLEYPDSTLLGVNRMLSDKEYRRRVVDNVKDPGVKSFWVDEFAKYNERYMQEAGDAIKNKIGQFTANPVIRNIVGQPKSSFDIRKMMDEQKILLINLSKGLIGETNANLLGSMLTTRIYLAAMSRADLSPEKMRTMPNFYFYVDEFQSFANSTFANILSEARKYHLNLTIAHQYIEQMEEDVRNAVFGNVGTMISFRVGPFDAETLETIFTPQFLATDIVNLGYTQIYLTLMIDGIGSQPFSAATLPPIQPPVISYRDMVVASSRKQFAHTRDEVELNIQKFHEPLIPEKTQKFEEKKREEGRPYSEAKKRSDDGRVTGQTTSAPPYASENASIRREKTPHSQAPYVTSAQKNEYKQNTRVQSPRTNVDQRKQKEAPAPQSAEDLRSILRSVIEAEKKSEHTSPAAQGTIESVSDQESRQTRVESKPDKSTHTDTEVTQLPKEESISVKEESSPRVSSTFDQAHSQSITPNELERMMRITNKDNAP
jgi:hypothetical protein